ncbi:MAG: hypothetical protein R3F37_07780 [Candidatus Competibacteraceae bacterium]
MAKVQRTFVISDPFRIGVSQLRHRADDLDKQLRNKRRSKASWGVLLIIGAVVSNLLGWIPWIPLIFTLGIATVVCFIYAFTYKTSKDIEQVREMAQTAQRWHQDVHPQSPLHGQLDLSCPDQCEPKKTKKSAKKIKKYYRYRPIELKFALADGNLLAFQFITELKTKANQEVRRHTEVRGRLKLNPERYVVRDIASRFGNLSARLLRVDNQHHICFWGKINSATELEHGIAGIYRAITPTG